MTLSTEGSDLYTTQTTKITVMDAVQLTRCGEVVCKVDAVYDIANVPPEFHVMLLNLMMSRRISMALPCYEVRSITSEPTPEKRSWWRTFLGWLFD